MKAAQLHANCDLRVDEVDTPRPAAGEVLVKVAYCGICGSDIPRLIKDGAHFYPIILGHEFSGVIEAVGEGVADSWVGKKVACAPLVPNFDDPQSHRGNYSLSKGYSFIGSRQQGGLAEYVSIPLINAVPLPESIDLKAGSFLEPVTVGLHAINIMDFKPGRPVAVIGVGTIGQLLLQALKSLGAGPITAFDVDDEKLAAAKEVGATYTCNSMRPEEVEAAMATTEGAAGFDAVFENSGVPAAEIMSLKVAGPNGKVMFVGTPHAPLTLQPAEFELINRKELIVQGSWMNYSAPFPGWEWTYGADILSNGTINLDNLVDKVVPLSQAPQIIELLQTKGAVKGKIIVDCQA
ncbi:galactitol-1-phosphate 5-dehydrogenase [Polycladidibacter stylochi]|uniref:galactitol-1-phosphate 5-dehydrogenase n=1 Tax=Polycladidibacter stylochi TaxID=1807766 RepID=UPI00082F41F7|nr:galactitol-1-phosphate 5-dehydrogenase [Pseudovibrio stylochi]